MFSTEIIKRMNADEVRRRAKAASDASGPALGDLIRRVDKAVQAAAGRGEFSLTKNPIAGVPLLTPGESRAVWADFRKRGYTVSIRRGGFRLSWK